MFETDDGCYQTIMSKIKTKFLRALFVSEIIKYKHKQRKCPENIYIYNVCASCAVYGAICN